MKEEIEEESKRGGTRVSPPSVRQRCVTHTALNTRAIFFLESDVLRLLSHREMCLPKFSPLPYGRGN